MALPIRESPSTERPSASGEGLSYWQLVRRDFLRNRLALASGIVILFVAVVAILCPLLANNRPLYIRAVLPDEYNNALQILIEQSAGMDSAPSEAERDKSRSLIIANYRNMRRHLGGGDQAKLDALMSPFIKAGGKIDSGEISKGLDPFFDFTLVPVEKYPAFRALTTVEIALIAALVLFPVIFGLLRRRSLPARLGTLLAVALLATAALRAVYPSVQDATPYREIIESEEFRKDGRVVRTLVPFGENENILVDSRQPPTWSVNVEKRGANWHWLGTDTNGRDVLARMIYGTRVSMLVSIVAVAIYTMIGMLLGAVAGYFRGWTDIIISRLTEVVICFPALMVILSVQAFLKPSILNIILTMAALWWTGVQRLQRGEFLRLVNLDYVQAVRALGGSNLRIMAMHILPNALGPILVMTSFGIAGAILVESALSFLGFGVPQPMASWGDLLNNGRNDINGTWWLTVFPGLAIFLTVTCFNLVGEGFRDALDPQRER